MKFEITSRWKGTILYADEAESFKALLIAAVKSRANLYGANLSGANLYRADLSGADLYGADLSGANLTDADLRDARYGEHIPLTKTPIQISGLIWDVMILDTHLKIGCELHSFAEWENFSDQEIAKMEERALPWWKQHKEMIFAVIRATRGG